jgi:hypothetical protein
MISKDAKKKEGQDAPDPVVPSNPNTPAKYHLLEELLALSQMTLQPTFSVCDIAKLFHVSTRSIQSRVASGQLASRDLPGRAKFLPVDIEEFLHESKKGGRK